METIRDVLESIRSHVRARLSNPLFGAYVLAWCVLNFRLLLVLVGEGGWREKIRYIDESLYPEHWHWLIFGFVYPLVVAVMLILISPFVQRWVTVFLREREKVTIARLLQVAGETPLDPADAERLRKRLIDERQLRRDESQRRESEVSELTAQIELLKKQLDALQTDQRNAAQAVPLTPVSNDVAAAKKASFTFDSADFVGDDSATAKALLSRGLSNAEVETLYVLRSGKEMTASQLAEELDFDEVYDARLILDRLDALQLVTRILVPGEKFMITSVGRQALGAAQQRGFVPKLKKI